MASRLLDKVGGVAAMVAVLTSVFAAGGAWARINQVQRELDMGRSYIQTEINEAKVRLAAAERYDATLQADIREIKTILRTLDERKVQ